MRIERITQEISRDKQEDIDLNRLDPLINKYKGKKGNLIPLLQGTQSLYGYLPDVAFAKISRETGLELSDMYGVATFYAQFRLKPAGKIIIKICHGTACHVQNANTISDSLEESLKIKDGETTEDGLFTLESVACLGCCSLAPVMMVGENTFGKLTGTEAVRIVKNIRMEEIKNSN
jgi:NADH-quinone oxidoreductase subunit E